MPAKSMTTCLALVVCSCSLDNLSYSAMTVEFGPGHAIVLMWRESKINHKYSSVLSSALACNGYEKALSPRPYRSQFARRLALISNVMYHDDGEELIFQSFLFTLDVGHEPTSLLVMYTTRYLPTSPAERFSPPLHPLYLCTSPPDQGLASPSTCSPPW